MIKKLSKFDFQYLVEAAQAFEKQIPGITAYPDPNCENKLIVIHQNLIKYYELTAWENDYQEWINQFQNDLSKTLVEKETCNLEL